MRKIFVLVGLIMLFALSFNPFERPPTLSQDVTIESVFTDNVPIAPELDFITLNNNFYSDYLLLTTYQEVGKSPNDLIENNYKDLTNLNKSGITTYLSTEKEKQDKIYPNVRKFRNNFSITVKTCFDLTYKRARDALRNRQV